MAKMNSLVCPKVIRALNAASRAGVKVHLVVRGICCLRPGVRGLSENIRVISIVDRFLEHSRMIYVRHGGADLVYISSADWMPRNLDKRVELLVPVEDERAKRRMIEVLEVGLKDTVKAQELQPDGSYEPVRPKGRRKRLRSQEALYHAARLAAQEAAKGKRTVFEPHRPAKKRRKKSRG
jgi:polyphosphate kinase